MTTTHETIPTARPIYPLDDVTRGLLTLLAAKSEELAILDTCLGAARREPALPDFLTAMRQQAAASIQQLEPMLRDKLRAHNPTSPCEPW